MYVFDRLERLLSARTTLSPALFGDSAVVFGEETRLAKMMVSHVQLVKLIVGSFQLPGRPGEMLTYFRMLVLVQAFPGGGVC